MRPQGLFAIFIFTSLIARAQVDSVKSYTTARLQGEPPHIDGHLNDPAWNQVPWGGGDFRQKNPDAGKPASVQTKFKILYDAKNLYIAFKNYDPEPDKIVSRMSRRDGFEGDWVEINIDSYYDKRSAFSFTSSVSGVKGDEYISNNGANWDPNWDPIWYLKTSIDEEGWIAELRIPLSQLRFAEKPELTWGFQIQRLFFRNQEVSNWQYIPPDAAGWVHLFGELKGIKGIKPQKQLEVQPYVVTKTETFEEEEGNPFMTGKSSGIDVGMDAKIGITSDITLDLTVNPDFGQVEADPSQVNLSAFRLFFVERRPFFIEGNNTLNFPLVDFNSNNLFYSRRIGRNPQIEVDTDKDGDDDGVDEYVKTTKYSTILGAAKLTGKNKKGFSWGILESVTDAERALIDSAGVRKTQLIEPLTNYLVARAQQDINKGNTIVGGMLTATNRNINDRHLNELHNDAYSGGLDLVHNWKDRKYYVSFKTMFSNVQGSTQAIKKTQEASERYFQRPDNNHAHVDSTRRSLTGTGGAITGGKRSGKFIYEAGLMWLSPQLELNDIGFLTQTDQVSEWIWLQYRILKPLGKFRSMRYNFIQWRDWDFDARSTASGFDANANLEFKNFWQLSTGGSLATHFNSNADLRGGPTIYYPGSTWYWFSLSTDRRKKLQVSINPQFEWGMSNYKRNRSVELQINYRPINAFNISVAPSLSDNSNLLQYVTTGTVNGEDKYMVAQIDQTIARVTIRMTYMITPNLSLQYWGQPFGTSGLYSNYKYVTDADASDYRQRFSDISSSSISQVDDDNYAIDENQDGVSEYKFEKPDFNFGQFRSNFVIRWEYIPGSTAFLVWTQEKNGAFYDESGPIHKRYNFDFDEKGHNIFLLKFTYRFIL
jgi:hypothetical protein